MNEYKSLEKVARQWVGKEYCLSTSNMFTSVSNSSLQITLLPFSIATLSLGYG